MSSMAPMNEMLNVTATKKLKNKPPTLCEVGKAKC